MFPLSVGAVYKTPESHQPPDDADLATNTEYPNLNSRDYAKHAINRTLRMHEAWECISLHENQHAIIATNKLSGREWAGSIWGFEQLDSLTPENACYKLQTKSLISQLKVVSKNMFLLALHSGEVQLWSSYSEVRNAQNPYCLFLVGEKCEHQKPVVSMDVATSAAKAITGSRDGTLKLWDMGSADVLPIGAFRFAHLDVITGIEFSHKDASIFATCSLDKSALLWDDRLARPAVALFENHNVRFKNLAWASQTLDENLLYLGDESGNIHNVDIRLPNVFVNSAQYYNRPIRKIIPNSGKLGVIGDTNAVKISSAENHKIIYENSDAQNFVRDGVWQSSSCLMTVGYEGKMRKHKIRD